MKKQIVLIALISLMLIVGLCALTGCTEKKENTAVNTNNTQNAAEPTQTAQTSNSSSTNSKGYVYEYKSGVLTQIVDEEGKPKQTDFVIDGIILVGNRHDYNENEEDIEYLAKKGYNKTGINSSFYLNEYIEFYIDTKYTGSTSDVKILITPHDTVENYEKLSFAKLTELAEEKGATLDYAKPDADNHKYVGNQYVSMDLPEGKYDILFTYKGKLAYFICVDMAKEPAE